MKRTYFFTLLFATALSIALIFFFIFSQKERPSSAALLVVPSKAPFSSYIAATGIVEASSGDISIGTPLNRIVEEVFVQVGDSVKKGQILLQLENKDLQAELLRQEIAVNSAKANLNKLEALPRKEELAASRAALERAQADLNQAQAEFQMVLTLADPRALSLQERNRRQFALQQNTAKVHQAEAELTKVAAGTWEPDLEIARLKLKQAQAQQARLKAELARTTLAASIDGAILQSNARAGELPSSPLFIIGDIRQKHLRVSINQYDIPSFQADAAAVAYLQGSMQEKFPLEFVRVEPYLLSKKNINNDINEKVDTKTLEIIYRIIEPQQSHLELYVGQQMDVFIDEKK